VHYLSGLRAHPVLWRVLAAVVGAYVFCWGEVALCVVSFTALGMGFEDAEHLASMLTMLTYLVLFLWAFAASSLVRVWGVLAGGGAVMAALASLLQWQLVA